MTARGVMRLLPAFGASLLAACAMGSVVGPNRAIAQNAATLVDECRYDEAEALIQANLDTIPERYRGELLLSRGRVEEGRGQLSAAIEHYTAAAAARAAPERASRLLGRAQVRNQQFEDGYRTLLALHPDQSPLLRRNLDWVDMAALSVASAETGRLADAMASLADAYRLASQPYDPVIPQLRAHITAARATTGAAAPGSFWQLAYGTEGTGLALDTRPVVLDRKFPDVPMSPKAERAGGYVLLLLDISETGAVTGAKVLEADPPGALEKTSTAAVSEWRFEPAKDQCKAVATSGLQRFEFGAAR